MTMNLFTFRTLLLFLFFSWSCEPEPPSIPEDDQVHGLAPVYISKDSLERIGVKDSRSVSRPGPVEKWNEFLFIREGRDGYHVINTSDVENVSKEAFWQIPGTSQLQIEEERAYIDNFHYLLVVDLTAAPDLEIISREQVVELNPFLLFPRYHQGYYECYDPDSGLVLEWRMEAELKQPWCYNQEL
jgi:hypothetical protein